MERIARLGRGVGIALVVLGTSALVVVGLLTGACSRSPSPGYCFRPGICYDATPDGSTVYSCPHGDAFAEGTCPSALRVGRCETATRSVYLYAPLHGILPPDCASIAGPGARYVRE